MAAVMPSAGPALVPSPALPYGNWAPALFIPHRRSIGGIVAQVTLDEQHTDELHITDHPVEQGSPISDHAFKQPNIVNIHAAWSAAYAYDLSAETGIYGLLLSWQSALVPFDVITGKRSYSSMLIQRLGVTTDAKSEWALMAQIECRQVILVATQTVQVTAMSNQPQDQSNPQTTAPNTENGPKSTTTPDASTGNQAGNASVVNDPNASSYGSQPGHAMGGTAGSSMFGTTDALDLNSGAAGKGIDLTTINGNPTLDLGGNAQSSIGSSGTVP